MRILRINTKSITNNIFEDLGKGKGTISSSDAKKILQVLMSNDELRSLIENKEWLKLAEALSENSGDIGDYLKAQLGGYMYLSKIIDCFTALYMSGVDMGDFYIPLDKLSILGYPYRGIFKRMEWRHLRPEYPLNYSPLYHQAFNGGVYIKTEDRDAIKMFNRRYKTDNPPKKWVDLREVPDDHIREFGLKFCGPAIKLDNVNGVDIYIGKGV